MQVTETPTPSSSGAFNPTCPAVSPNLPCTRGWYPTDASTYEFRCSSTLGPCGYSHRVPESFIPRIPPSHRNSPNTLPPSPTAKLPPRLHHYCDVAYIYACADRCIAQASTANCQGVTFFRPQGLCILYNKGRNDAVFMYDSGDSDVMQNFA